MSWITPCIRTVPDRLTYRSGCALILRIQRIVVGITPAVHSMSEICIHWTDPGSEISRGNTCPQHTHRRWLITSRVVSGVLIYNSSLTFSVALAYASATLSVNLVASLPAVLLPLEALDRACSAADLTLAAAPEGARPTRSLAQATHSLTVSVTSEPNRLASSVALAY